MLFSSGVVGFLYFSTDWLQLAWNALGLKNYFCLTPFCFWRDKLFNSSEKYWQSVWLVTKTTRVLGWPHVAGKIAAGIYFSGISWLQPWWDKMTREAVGASPVPIRMSMSQHRKKGPRHQGEKSYKKNKMGALFFGGGLKRWWITGENKDP